MTNQEIHTIVMETFHKQKENPNAPFQTSRKLLQAMELRFSICFKNADYDRHYTVDQLVEKIKARIENPRGNMMIIQERIADRKSKRIYLALVFIPTVSYFKVHVVSFIATALVAIAMWSLIRSHRGSHLHNERLLKKMNAGKSAP
jgi:hypothetical protein